MWEKREIKGVRVETNNVNVLAVGYFGECFSASALDGRLACFQIMYSQNIYLKSFHLLFWFMLCLCKLNSPYSSAIKRPTA